MAALEGHLDVLKWAIEHACLHVKEGCILLSKREGHDAIVEWQS